MNDRLSGWGRQFRPGREVLTEDLEHAPRVLFRGLGRSCGDASLPPPGNPVAVNTTRANRILRFDEATGLLRAEAGLSLRDINLSFLHRGWFLPLTPGTQYVTLGGAVAADVHGKNHHVDGCFGQHVTRLKMRVADGRVLECGPDLERELFLATVAGMGLTGQILEVEFPLRRIPTPWIWQETERVPDIDALVEVITSAARHWPMTMGWIDCLLRGAHMGRGIVMKGRWAHAHEAPETFPRELSQPRLPFEFPTIVLSPLTVKAFNVAYCWKHLPKKREGLASPWTFFYLLDVMRDFNRMYGRRGFTQYQCVLPREAGPSAARRFLEVLTARGGASFRCVIKACGPENAAFLSFPKPGISIALDIPVRDDTQALVDALNEQVLKEGGRIYLATDRYTRPEHFRAMERRLEKFLDVRLKWDPNLVFRSAQSVRLFGDPA
jgi:FAD/FMN-containing dehydrogenase